MGIIKRRLFFLNTTVAYYVKSWMFLLIKGSLSFFLSFSSQLCIGIIVKITNYSYNYNLNKYVRVCVYVCM